MKALVLWVLASAALLTGCATSTIESRKQERYSAFAELTPEERVTVESGQIKVGLSMDGVYIAWGKPGQVLTGETSKGILVTWLYYDTYLESYPQWRYYPYAYSHRYRCGYYGAPYYASDYYPRSYVRAEVIFDAGKVREWRSLPHPPY